MNQKVTAQSQQHLKLIEINLNCNLLVRDNLRFDFGDFKHKQGSCTEICSSVLRFHNFQNLYSKFTLHFTFMVTIFSCFYFKEFYTKNLNGD